MSKNICTIAVAAVALTTASIGTSGDAFAFDRPSRGEETRGIGDAIGDALGDALAKVIEKKLGGRREKESESRVEYKVGCAKTAKGERPQGVYDPKSGLCFRNREGAELEAQRTCSKNSQLYDPKTGVCVQPSKRVRG